MQWENVYIFISSTFNDMHAERDYLVKSVFPELTAWCEERKLRLIDIDLRWGVKEEDTTDKNTVKVCLDRIDECRPFFLCFLGQRRGWVPGQEDISAQTKAEYPQIGGYIGKYSITEMEIEHALLGPLKKILDGEEKNPVPVEHAFFFLRDGAYVEDIPSEPKELRQVYTNDHIADVAERQQAESELAAWKDKIRRRQYADYSAEWDESASTPEIKSDDIPGLERGRLTGFESGGEALKDVILRQLKAAITTRFPDHRPILPLTEYDTDIEQQQQFLSLNKDGFIAREGDFDELNAYVESDSNALFVLTAPAGTGKSMLLANFAAYRPEGECTVARFIGASDKSTDAYRLWKSIFTELGVPVPSMPGELLDRLPMLLEELGKKQDTVIILDAINQLDTGLQNLGWLPHTLPPGVKLIVSFKEEGEEAQRVLRAMREEGRVILSRVHPFESDDDKRAMINAYLDKFLKALDDRHIQTICGMPGADNPLFLKILLSELRVFGSFTQLGRLIEERFGSTPVQAFEGVLARLEEDPAYGAITPEKAVPYLFGLLGCARRGLSEQELLTCFRMEFPQATGQEAKDTVYLYFRQMRPFLARRENRTDFLYESFAIAARQRYGAQRQHLQQRLVQCFAAICDPMGDASYEEEDPRALSELGWHTRQLDGGEALYASLAYLHARCSAGGTGELLLEMEPFQNDAIAGCRKLVFRFAEELSHFPNLLFSIARHGGPQQAVAQANELLSSGRWRRPWMEIGHALTAQMEQESGGGVPLSVESRMTLTNTVAAQYAAGREVVFYTEGMGRIRILHTDTMKPSGGYITTRAVRPLRIFCSQDGGYMAVAFEDMTADVLAVHYDDAGMLAYAETIGQVTYLLPLYEDGVFAFDGNALYYQQEESSITRAVAGDGGLQETVIPLPQNGEVSAIVCGGEGVAVALRDYDDTAIVWLGQDDKARHIVKKNVDVACAAALPNGRAAFSFTDGSIGVFDGELNETAGVKAGQPMMAMCAVGESLFCLSELYNRCYVWNMRKNTLQEDANEWLGRTRTAYLKPYENGSMLFVSDTMAVKFSTGGQTGVEEPEIIGAFEEEAGHCIVVARGRGQFGVYDKNGSRMLDDLGDIVFVQHAKGEVAVFDNTGNGFTVSSGDLHTGRLSLGTSVVCAAGVEEGGYYLYDSAGFLRRWPEGVQMPGLKEYVLASISMYVAGNKLIITGIADDAKAGIEHKNFLALFYEMQPSGALQLLGKRYFDTGGGQFITVASDGETYYMLFSTPNIGKAATHPVMRFGSMEDILNEREQAVELPIGKRHVTACCKGDTLYICANGLVFAYGKRALDYRCGVAAGETFRMVAQTAGGNDAVFGVEGKNNLVYIKENEGGRK